MSNKYGELKSETCILQVSRWAKDFNPHNQKQANAECWIRIYDLSMEYRGTVILANIARGVGMPLKVNPNTQGVGSYAQVQVDADYSKELPVKVLVQRKKAGFDFFANVYYEFVPYFCHGCQTTGHKMENYRAAMRRQATDSLQQVNQRNKEQNIDNVHPREASDVENSNSEHSCCCRKFFRQRYW